MTRRVDDLTLVEVAALHGVTLRCVENWVQLGRLPSRLDPERGMPGPGRRLVKWSDAAQVCRGGRVRAELEPAVAA